MVTTNGRTVSDQSSMNAYIKSICDIMRRDNTKGAMEYIPELTWMMFLRILDEKEEEEQLQSEAVGDNFEPSLDYPYRWRDWGSPEGKKRKELQEGQMNAFLDFVNEDLIPHLKAFDDREENPNATKRQKIISQIFRNLNHTRLGSEKNLLDVLDKVEHLTSENIDATHQFPLSQIYEGLLLKMGEKNNDGGQFFTPREVIRAMIRAVKPDVKHNGEYATFYDPGCGTGGFLAENYTYLTNPEISGLKLTASDYNHLKHDAFWGLDSSFTAFPIALANLVLHGIDQPHIGLKNTLSGRVTYMDLFEGAPYKFNYIFTNPPFGGKEGEDAKANFAFKTGNTQILFIQHIIDHLADDGTCAMVIDEGVLFRTNETAFVQTKRKLLDECNLWCILSLSQNVFLNAGAGVKTNLLFFTKGKSTEKIWYYDMSDIKILKKSPLTLDKFDDFLMRLHSDKEEDKISEKSWYMDINTIKKKDYDIKAVNPNTIEKEIPKPAELIKIIEESQAKINESLQKLKELT
ncbi:N-6 DNA methylase [Methanolobus psychrophilus R15]|nr:N-6 DNA methylase [Methanolobus psychrophilus R15]